MEATREIDPSISHINVVVIPSGLTIAALGVAWLPSLVQDAVSVRA